jgi:hypothetical protein
MRAKRSTSRANRTSKLKVGSASLFGDSEPIDFAPLPKKPLVVPTRWVNAIIGVFLLPIAAIGTQTFFTIFSTETLNHSFWATEEFWFFALGVILWLVAFFGLPRPIVVYVFGHELTHAIWVWLMGGRVSDFKVSREGGHILTDKHNVWIALAPYFYPIYSVAVVILYGILALFCDVAPYTRWLFLALGITWAFHISFTAWMIPKGQSDLTYHGTFFSLVIIYLMNLALLSALVIIAAPDATFWTFAHELMHNAIWFSHLVIRLVHKSHALIH